MSLATRMWSCRCRLCAFFPRAGARSLVAVGWTTARAFWHRGEVYGPCAVAVGLEARGQEKKVCTQESGVARFRFVSIYMYMHIFCVCRPVPPLFSPRSTKRLKGTARETDQPRSWPRVHPNSPSSFFLWTKVPYKVSANGIGRYGGNCKVAPWHSHRKRQRPTSMHEFACPCNCLSALAESWPTTAGRPRDVRRFGVVGILSRGDDGRTVSSCRPTFWPTTAQTRLPQIWLGIDVLDTRALRAPRARSQIKTGAARTRTKNRCAERSPDYFWRPRLKRASTHRGKRQHKEINGSRERGKEEATQRESPPDDTQHSI